MQKRVYDQLDYFKENRQRILVVDDESFCLMSLCSLLRSCQVDVEKVVDVAMNGEEAIRSVKTALQLGIRYQLIFTDISMPHMDGMEATKAIIKLYEQ